MQITVKWVTIYVRHVIKSGDWKCEFPPSKRLLRLRRISDTRQSHRERKGELAMFFPERSIESLDACRLLTSQRNRSYHSLATGKTKINHFIFVTRHIAGAVALSVNTTTRNNLDSWERYGENFFLLRSRCIKQQHSLLPVDRRRVDTHTYPTSAYPTWCWSVFKPQASFENNHKLLLFSLCCFWRSQRKSVSIWTSLGGFCL